MRILIAGGDGFCGWPTALYLSKQGHQEEVIRGILQTALQYKERVIRDNILPGVKWK